MVANTLVRPAGFGANSEVLSSEMQALQVQSAQGVNRHSTKSGTINFPIVPVGSDIVDKPAVGWDPTNMKVHIYDDASAGHSVYALDRLPDGHTLESVVVKLKPAAGHAGAPGTLPRLRVIKIGNTGTSTALGSATYVWVDDATYEAGITLTVNGLGETVDLENYRYLYEIRTEGGAGSVSPSFLEIQAVMVEVTMDVVEGGADLNSWLKA